MVLGDIADVRAIAGHVTSDEMADAKVTEYLEGSTAWVENKTGIVEANWATHEDYNLAKIASENYAAAFVVLVVSTVKEKTDRHRELLGAAERAMDAIMEGATTTGDEDNPFFIDVNSEYKTYENNPVDIAPYESFK